MSTPGDDGTAPTCSATTEVAAPADDLYAMVSDVTRMGEWSPEATGGTWLKGATGPAVGSRFRGRNRLGVRRWFTDNEVVEADVGRAFAFRTTSGPLAVSLWRYRFEPSADGSSTTVTEEWTDERGALVRWGGRLLTGVGDRAQHNRKSMEETLVALKAAAEGSAPPAEA